MLNEKLSLLNLVLLIVCHRLGLLVPHLSVSSIRHIEKLVVSALLNNFSMLKNDNTVSVSYSRESMSNDQSC